MIKIIILWLFAALVVNSSGGFGVSNDEAAKNFEFNDLKSTALIKIDHEAEVNGTLTEEFHVDLDAGDNTTMPEIRVDNNNGTNNGTSENDIEIFGDKIWEILCDIGGFFRDLILDIWGFIKWALIVIAVIIALLVLSFIPRMIHCTCCHSSSSYSTSGYYSFY